ncbi:MAG: NUDIX domain-containing protein [Thermotogota bacterium]
MSEKVWVCPTELIENNFGNLKEFNNIPFVELNKIFENSYFKKREEVENDESLRQIIPYVVFQKETGEILVVKRTKKQSEKRLHDKISVGIGGHINPIDKEVESSEMTFFNGLNREINEELIVHKLNKLEYIGIIYDNSNSVSRVHMGILFLAKVNDAEINEKENFENEWLLPSEIIKQNISKMETWSIVSLKALEVPIVEE